MVLLLKKYDRNRNKAQCLAALINELCNWGVTEEDGYKSGRINRNWNYRFPEILRDRGNEQDNKIVYLRINAGRENLIDYAQVWRMSKEPWTFNDTGVGKHSVSCS